MVSEPSLKEYINVCYQCSAVSQLSIETPPNRPQRVLGTRRDLAKKPCNICVKTAEPEFISSNTILAL